MCVKKIDKGAMTGVIFIVIALLIILQIIFMPA